MLEQPLPHGLSLPTSRGLHCERTFYHCMKLHPTAPENQPARGMIVFAILVASQSGQGEEELLEGEIAIGCPKTPSTEHRHLDSRQEVTGRSLIRIGSATAISQHQ
jgi:hypothetical protein